MARTSDSQPIQPRDRFRFCSKRIFLTYPQCDLTAEQLHNHFTQQGTVKYCIIAQELHANGDPHRHALIEYEDKLQFRDVRKFDVQGHHPSIERPRNWMASLNYCKKDNEFVEYGENQRLPEESIFEIAKTSSYEDFIEYCLKHKIAYAYMEAIWKRTHDNLTIRGNEPNSGVIRADLDELRYEETRKCLHIQGPTGIGKSSWAKREAPKPALWVTHMDNLKAFDPSIHKSIIFDDMSFIHIPREAQIHLVDNDDTRSIHIRYGVATIPAGTRKIFTSNGPIFSDDPAIARRVIKHIYS